MPQPSDVVRYCEVGEQHMARVREHEEWAQRGPYYKQNVETHCERLWWRARFCEQVLRHWTKFIEKRGGGDRKISCLYTWNDMLKIVGLWQKQSQEEWDELNDRDPADRSKEQFQVTSKQREEFQAGKVAAHANRKALARRSLERMHAEHQKEMKLRQYEED
ncbi:uncharacterized protein BO97DRAFT_193513 [Aspergillus homomorphus CBS 101889]|uniref:Uncharacterized protein n=1 Tax=Aspergillus homomorphus (strain CBS 101889) TaxID=1450537 RepID=A0A395HN38_ASPHC|nr:hypothetical protein BO97DRAFT_193513 [Aspergillus homomorphus CBS 101889]RAL08899.1 hypothetical protein BO97DRAFT_193513 [Aspergillus homomorphus CBS 101889]